MREMGVFFFFFSSSYFFLREMFFHSRWLTVLFHGLYYYALKIWSGFFDSLFYFNFPPMRY